MSLCLKVLDGQGAVLAQSEGKTEAFLVYGPEYAQGDRLAVEGEAGSHLVLQLDDAVPAARVYLKSGRAAFEVPFGEKRVPYSPRAFAGRRHLLWVRTALPEEIAARRNLACNPLDFHGNDGLFPHASANVETRGEAVFAARNAIDGLKANTSHGEWPYTSWGINRDPSAELKLEFGRTVILDEAALTLRADFPHDAWWTGAVLRFSDGSRIRIALRKTGAAQPVRFAPKTVDWVVLNTLVKAEDPSPFPALTQLECYGSDLE